MIRTVLCPVDFSVISDRELRLAAQLCQRFQARLVIQHCFTGVVPPMLGVSWMDAREHRQREETMAAEAELKLRQQLAALPRGVKGEGKIAFGSLDRCVLELAAGLPADLVIVGTHGRSSAEHRSLAERIILDAPCPVLTLRDDTPDVVFAEQAGGDLDTIPTLLPMDFSAHSRRALDHALALLAWLPLELHVLHVDRRGDADQEETVDRLRSMIPAEARPRVAIEARPGSSVEEILRSEAHLGARLVIMGTHHKNLVRRLLAGSTSRELLHASICPVWFVPEGAATHTAAA